MPVISPSGSIVTVMPPFVERTTERRFSTARNTPIIMCCISAGTENDHESLVMLTSTCAP